MENLPRDIHLDIFSRLPIISFLQIKCVCKAWLALSQDPRLPIMFYARANKRNPSLILHCDSPIVNKLCFISSEEGSSNKVLKIVPPFMSNMPEYQVVGSCNGLVCISDALYFDPIYVCNIFTGDYIELPKTSNHLEQDVALGFGNVPETKEYKIVRVVNYWSDEHSNVQILTIGTKAWRSLGPIHWKLDLIPSKAFLNGALHWVTKRCGTQRENHLRIAAFDLAEEKFKEIERPMCGSLDDSNFYLANLRGCLSAVVCQDERIEIWVMQVYNMKESWTKDYIITTNIPGALNKGARPKSKIWKHRTQITGNIEIEVVCMLKNGDILLNYEEGTLVLYSPGNGSFKELVFSGLPRWFSAITHVETIFSVEATFRV
ncbi:F-box-like domain superfamily [Sesbania bispinosa]|nr:F-box-like domain superfamily [Sesbania bispinosa]